MLKAKIIETFDNHKQVAFRFARSNNYVADTLVDEMVDEPNWIHVSDSQTSNSRLINLAVCQRIVIED